MHFIKGLRKPYRMATLLVLGIYCLAPLHLANAEPTEKDLVPKLIPGIYTYDDDELTDDEKRFFGDSPEVIELDAIDVNSLANGQIDVVAKPVFGQNITKATAVQSIGDFLEATPGIYGDTTAKGQRMVMVRGFFARQVEFRFDGVPLDTGYDGMTGLDLLPVNWVGLAMLRHADLSATDGVGFGGSIDFYAATPHKFEAALEVNRTGGVAALSHAYTHKAWSWMLSGGGHYSLGQRMSNQFKATPEEDGGLRDASDKRGYNAIAKVKRTLSDWGEIEASGAYSQAPRSVPTDIQTSSPRFWRFPSWHMALANLRLSFATKAIYGQVQAWYIEQGNTLNIYDDASRNSMLSPAASVSTWKDHDIGGKFEINSAQMRLGALAQLSLQIKSELRYQMHKSRSRIIFFETEENNDSSRLVYDIRPGFNIQFGPNLRFFGSGNFIATHGLTHHDNVDPKTGELKSIFNGGFSLGIDYAILSHLKLGLRAARRLRMPTLKEQFMRIPQQQTPDKALNAEVAGAYGIEVSYSPHPSVALSIAGYDNEISDLIALRYVQGVREAYNVDKARLAGLDIGAKLGPFYKLSLDLDYGYLYAYDLRNKQALNEKPAHNLRATLLYSPTVQLSFAIKAQYESKRRTETWMSANHAWLGDVFLLGAEITWTSEQFTAYIRGSNLLDMDYSRSLGFPEAGWNLSIGAKIWL